MLESFRRGQRWLTLALVIFVGGVFVFFMGVGGGLQSGGPTGNAVVELGDTRMQVTDFQRLRARHEQAYRQQAGDQFDARAVSGLLDSQTLRTMVETVVMAESAKQLGMRVSREEIQRLVRSWPDFRNESGKFDKDRFASYASYEFGSQRVFLDVMRQDLLRQKMVGLLYAQASVSPSELRDAALYGLEEVRIAYVAVDTASLPEGTDVDEAAIQTHLEENRDALRATYEEQLETYSVPEQVTARHILIRADSDGDSEALDEARARAIATRERVMGDEAFEDVAKEVSEDPGSSASGGDLGTFARGVNAAKLEEAAFSLEPGDISDVIQSEFGFHIVKVEAHEPASTRSFEEVGPELARSHVESELAASTARVLAEELAAAVAAGQSLEEASRERDLSLERTVALRRRPDGFIAGLGAAPEILDSAFTLSIDAASSAEIFEVANRLVLIQLLERTMPDADALEATIDQLRNNLLQAKRSRMIQDWIDTRREELETSGQLLVNAGLVISDT
jgi:peptidyl-prolyl cis-trans isomerase D